MNADAQQRSRSTRVRAGIGLIATAALLTAVFVGISVPAASAAESWQWVHQLGSAGYDQAYGVAVDGSGNTYVTGYTYGTLPGSAQANAGNADVFVAKYDPSGNRLWVDQLGSAGYDIANSIAVDASGDAYVTGYTDGTLPGSTEPNAGGTDAFVAKYDTSGNRLWVHELGSSVDDVGVGVAVDGTGNAYVTGYTYGTLPSSAEANAGNTDVFLAKYDPTGTLLRVDQLGSAGFDVGVSLAVDAAGDAYVTGYTYGTLPGSVETNAGSGDAFVAKYDATGAVVWIRQLGSTGNDNGNSIALDAAGDTYVTGSTNGTLPGSVETNAGSGDIFVAKYDPAGNVQWVHQLGTAQSDLGSGIVVDGSGNAYVTGYTYGTLPGSVETNAGGADVFVAKYDTTGSVLSVDQLGTASGDEGTGIAVDAAGDAYVTGYTNGTLPGSVETNVGATDMFVGELSFSSVATAPASPTAVTATAAPTSASVSWTAPADGGAAITGYTVTAAPGGASASVAGTQTTATVSGLTNGTSYTFTVTATNDVGTSAPSAASNAVTPADIPAAPTSVTAIAGDASAAVSWTASADDGDAVTSYTVTAAPGGASATGNGQQTTATVSGLTNGTSYTFTVTATNSAGTSTPSAPSNAVVPVAVPGAPTGVLAVAGSMHADVFWTAPSGNGSAITGYTVTAAPGGATATVDGSESAAIVTGLTDGTSYTFTVTATNEFGTSPPSVASNAVTPTDAPAAPTGVAAVAGDQQASVSWTAPSANGSAITGYTVTASPGGATVSVLGDVTTALATGLTNGTPYTFTVTATNGAGTSLPSLPSNAVTPAAAAVPDAPTNVVATAGESSASVTWVAPADNGTAISSYTVTAAPGGASSTVAGSQSAATVTGLTDGTAYTFTVTATNGVGTSVPSSPSNAVTPASLPAAPNLTVVAVSSGQVDLNWAPPAANGNAITGYTITAAPGGATASITAAQASCAGGSGECTWVFAGLTNGVAYTFTATATSASGTGPSSTPTAAVIPMGAPGAPTAVSAVAGKGQATVAWTLGATGGSAITGESVTASPGGITVNLSGMPTGATVLGLTNGVSYTFTVVATNALGTSSLSAPSNAVVPADAPGAPTGVSAAAVSRQATVHWNATAPNGRAITAYTVTASPGSTTLTVSGTQTHATLALPGPGTYRFSVRAQNAIGAGPASAPSNPITVVATQTAGRSGYWMLASNGTVFGFGDAAALGNAPGPAVAFAAQRNGAGYWVVDAAGDVSHFGAAAGHGGHPALLPGETVSTISATPSGNGYWLFTNRGRAFAYGDAHFYGDESGVTLNGPIIASVATPTGLGYYMVGSDGGVFTFGDARFHGSTGDLHLNRPIVGISPTPDNRGYWLVASDGGVFAFDAPFRGSMGAVHLNRPVNGLVAYGAGYLMVASDGGVFDFSDKVFVGSLAADPPTAPIIGITAFTTG